MLHRRERHLHARNLLGELDHARLLREIERQTQPERPLLEVAEPRAKYELTGRDDPSLFE